jgi:uncharacterized C2H2 Zn-finger protein
MVMSCEQIWREISNYVDGEIDARLRAEMDEHFKTCPRCTAVLAGTRNVVKLYGDERMLDVPAGFSVRLEKRIAQGLDRRVPAQRQWWSSWTAWLVPVAALLLIAGGVRLARSPGFRIPLKSQQAEPANNIPPDLRVVVSDGEKLFHVPGCKFIKDPNSERTMTAKEAIREGYTPCTRCLRQYLKTGLIEPHGHAGKADDEAQEEEGPITGAAVH